MATMELSATAKAILGHLQMGPRSGYELKTAIDNSTRFFWSASFGSIYPELKRLREAGLIEGSSDPAGDRRRVVHRITPEGERALAEWAAGPPQPMDLRDEALLMTFFAEHPEQAAAALEAKAASHAETLARLAEIEPAASEKPTAFPLLTLRYGQALHEFARDWCERRAGELRERPERFEQRRGTERED
jgi:PadR family transcriptional regulator, regulatory protein AphA